MRSAPRERPGEAQWESSLLAVDTEILIAVARNYLGPVKTPYDKRVIAGRLASFVRKPETREAMLGLLDIVDARILGTVLLAGPLSEEDLRALFGEELRVFDLGIRIANLVDRLLLFRMESPRESLLAVNPLLAGELESRVLVPGVMMGLEAAAPGGSPGSGAGAEARQGSDAPTGASLIVALFGFLNHSPGSLRKNGAPGKKAAARLLELLPGLGVRPAFVDAAVRGLHLAGALVRDEEGEGCLETDPVVFGELLAKWGEALPLRLAAAIVAGGQKGNHGERLARGESLAAFVGASLSKVPEGAILSLGGLRRWLGIAALRTGFDRETANPAALVESLLELGVLETAGAGSVSVGQGRRLDRARDGARVGVASVPVLVADGSHLLRLLPEAGLEERWFLLLLAEPRGFAKVWELELDRATMRRAFAAGLDAETVLGRLEALAGRTLPQSLAFSIRSWEGEYRSLRLYHGFVLVCDERKRLLLERTPALADLIMEKLAEGVYMLAVTGVEEIRDRLVAAGLEAPPEIHSHAHLVLEKEGLVDRGTGESSASRETEGEVLEREATRLHGELLAADAAVPAFDPLPRLEALRAGLGAALAVGPAATGPGAADRAKELADRVEARLILDPEQLRRADLNVERVEAGGLDYAGKVRLVERALRSPGDRLEMQYQLSGAAPARALLRPVRLEKSDRGLVLEAEDLGTGGPLRVPLGAASLVRRLRASPFGEAR